MSQNRQFDISKINTKARFNKQNVTHKQKKDDG